MSIAQPLLDLPWYALAALPVVILLAYTVFGATGFGSSIITVPALAHLFPLTFTVPLATSLDVLAATTTSLRLRRLAWWKEVAHILPAIVVGIALGGTLLLRLPRAPALLALGIFVAAYGAWVLIGPRQLTHAPGWAAWPIGIVGGVFSVLFGTGGPIYIIYLSARIADKAALRATSAVIVTASVWIRFALFVVTGLMLHAQLLLVALVLLPVMVGGLRLGNRLHDALSRQGVLKLIAGLLVGNGIALVVRAAELLRV
ncbi:MAG: sulfite exporter TauE/SafE family protein [Proteobacteria bacterium]|nr:sulfite exporter TauE/SafE family protein [Pseudomonadota bacterium]